jgi:hypothetical protein
MNTRRLCMVGLFALTGFCWTGVGQTADPTLTIGELSTALRPDCSGGCDGAPAFSVYWLNKTATGDLFVVVREGCQSGDCASWLVEKAPAGAVLLLTLHGHFKLSIADADGYPGVEVKKALSDAHLEYTRYVWSRDGYVTAESKDVYRVDGIECGTATECDAVAVAALRSQRAAYAIKIWETIRGVPWV